MPSTKKLRKLDERYEILRAQLSKIGLIQVGTITRRMDRRRSESAPGGWVERGPYYQWTWKERGKTRTRNLSAARARAWGKAIQNQRKLEKILLEMREISLKILEETVPSDQKRKTGKQREK